MINCYRQLCTLAALILLSGCESEPTDPAIRFGIATAPLTLDPRYASDSGSQRISDLLYRGLVVLNDESRAIPDAASWETLSASRYRFEFDRGARFHDGELMRAADAKATYESILDADSASPFRAGLSNIKSISIEEQALVFELFKADPFFTGHLTLGIIKENETALAKDKHKTTSGDFSLRGVGADGSVSLSRVRDRQLFQFKVVRDPNVRALKLINSELDLIQGSMPPETAAWLAGRAETVVESYAGDTFTYLGINHQHPVLSKHAVRAAIAHGIDRQAIATHLFAGRATTANRVFPEGHWLGSASSNAYEYDPDKARQLLRGFSPDTLKFSYKTSTDPLRLRVAAVIKAQLEAIGIAIDIQSFDWATFYSDVRNGRFDLYSLSWTGLRLPDFYRQAFHSESVPPNGVNRGRYRNAEVDQLLDEATRAVTAREQLTLYTGMGNFLAEDLPYIPLWFEKHVVARRVEIASYRTRLSGGYAALNAVSKKWGRHGN